MTGLLGEGIAQAGEEEFIEEKGERSIRRDAAPEKMLWSAVLTWLSVRQREQDLRKGLWYAK